MKKIFVWLMLALPLVVMAQVKKPFIIKGTARNISLPGNKVAIIYSDNGRRIADTAIVVNNEYTFTGNISEPLLAEIFATYHYGTEGRIEPGSFAREIGSKCIYLRQDRNCIRYSIRQYHSERIKSA